MWGSVVILQSQEESYEQKNLGNTALECLLEKEPVIEWCVMYRMAQTLCTMLCSVFNMKISNVILSLCIACSYVWLNETKSQGK
jgi:hypothetical protein